jgi:leucyl-tRNA synthetase
VCINSGRYDGLDFARPSMRSPRISSEGAGRESGQYRLRDWGISRQRYWGTPDPDRPLRQVRRRAGARRPAAGGAARGLRARRQRQSAQQAPDFVNEVPEVRRAGARETDTMDTFVDSSWYYMRYACPDNGARWSTSA